MKISRSTLMAKLGTTPKSKITPELVSASSIVSELFESTIHNGPLVEFYIHELISNYPEELPPLLYSWRILWTSTILLEYTKTSPRICIPRKKLFSVNHLRHWLLDLSSPSRKLRRFLPLMRSSLTLMSTNTHHIRACISFVQTIDVQTWKLSQNQGNNGLSHLVTH